MHVPYHAPLLERSRLGAPRLYVWLAALWCVVFLVSDLSGLPTRYGGLVVGSLCVVLTLARPAREVPFALLVLATIPFEPIIFIGAVAVALRCLARRDLYLVGGWATRLFLVFITSAALSMLLGWTTVEFQPLQALFWGVSLLAPLSLLFLRFEGRDEASFRDVVRFATGLLLLQTLLACIQLVTQPPPIRRGDWVRGTWDNANIAGYWGCALLIGVVAWALLATRRERRRVAWRLPGVLLAAFALTVLPDAKAYSGALLLAGAGVFACAWVPRSISTWGRAFATVAVLALTLVVGVRATEAWLPGITKWGTPILEKTRKAVFLRRVFSEIDERYSGLLGVGPGMLGSRAANAVSQEVLYKEVSHLPAYFSDAPAPMHWGMAGLWDEELSRSIKWTSATLTFPFSGLGAVKAELGWIGLLVFHALIVVAAAGFLMSSGAGGPPLLRAAGVAIGTVLLGNLILFVFDTVWEMPRITVFAGALCLAWPAACGSGRTARASGPPAQPSGLPNTAS